MYLYLDKVELSISSLAQSCTLDSTLEKWFYFIVCSQIVVAPGRAIFLSVFISKIERFDENLISEGYKVCYHQKWFQFIIRG